MQIYPEPKRASISREFDSYRSLNECCKEAKNRFPVSSSKGIVNSVSLRPSSVLSDLDRISASTLSTYGIQVLYGNDSIAQKQGLIWVFQNRSYIPVENVRWSNLRSTRQCLCSLPLVLESSVPFITMIAMMLGSEPHGRTRTVQYL
jgi:hypothetical protein